MDYLFRHVVTIAAVLLTGAYVAAIGSELSGFRFTSDIQSTTFVDRAHKSDKLMSVQVSKQPAKAVPARVETMRTPPPASEPQDRKILEGCDPVVSPLAVTAGVVSADLAGRCLAALALPLTLVEAG